jgi:hypothetical protein
VRFDLSGEMEAEYSNNMNRFRVFENTVLREIFGCTKDEARGKKITRRRALAASF